MSTLAEKESGHVTYWVIDTDTGEELSGPLVSYRRTKDAMAEVAFNNLTERVHVVRDIGGEREPTGDTLTSSTAASAVQ